jgi:type IV pilus assembly protein PilA
MISRMRSAMRSEEGFTLIELMIVVAIIGILAAVAVPNFIAYRDRSRQAALMATAQGARAALAAYASDEPTGNLYPATGDIANILKENGTTLPTSVTGHTYTAKKASETAPERTDYTLEIKDASENKACATPAQVKKGGC